MPSLEQSSYTFPSPAEVYSYPYAALKNGIYGNLAASVPEYESNFNEVIDQLLTLLSAMINNESSKEKNFIQSYLNKIGEEDTQFKTDLQRLFDNKQYSLAFEMIQNRIDKIYDLQEDLMSNKSKFKIYWENFENKLFYRILEETFSDLSAEALLDYNFDEVFNLMKDKLMKEMQSKEKQPEYSEYQKFLDQYFDLIKEVASKQFATDYQRKWTELEEWKYVQMKRKEHASKGRAGGESPLDLIKGYISGIVNGLSSEQYLVTFGGGISTARVGGAVTGFTGKNMGNLPIETDVLSIYDGNFEINSAASNEIENMVDNTRQELYNIIKKYSTEDNFIIHYSSKDLSTNKNYGTSGTLAAKIKGTGSLDTRMGPLKEISSILNANASITNLIFALVNAVPGMVAEKDKEKITQAVTSLCIAYMFEDFDDMIMDTVKPMSSGAGNSLHIYIINGNYYVISDVLQLIYNQIANRMAGRVKNVLTVSFNPIKYNAYEKISQNKKIQGREKWEKVRAEILSGGSMEVKMNVKNLSDLISIF